MLKLAFSLKGRIPRQNYWLGYLALIFTNIVALAIADSGDPDISALGALIFLGLIWPAIAINVKRWHDRDKSGAWILINLVPMIGPLWSFIELGFLPGTDGANRFDQNFKDHPGAVREVSNEPTSDVASEHARENVEAELGDMIAMLAKIAKSDGSISKSEIEIVDGFFSVIFKSPDEQAYARDIFRHAKDSNHTFEAHARNFAQIHQNNPNLLRSSLTILFRLSMADGSMSAEEELLLNEAMSVFGMRCEQYDNYKAQQQNNSQGEVKNAAYYANLLGVSETTSPGELRKKYLKLVAEYHPDKVAHLGERLRVVAEEEMKKINEAYDYLSRK